ncbi:hypothetical protein EIP91_007033 [Steccherinum ochraceum]|uniref:Uncharacterized protein n=1 Tax=Steccherinum ochraceum TaxID=92696 RepID=A0A4R0RLL3_9APHY|nr:hypothetical protein EIP91_007033 [Steccherinum ochraceum]
MPFDDYSRPDLSPLAHISPPGLGYGHAEDAAQKESRAGGAVTAVVTHGRRRP